MSARPHEEQRQLDTGWMTDAACLGSPGLPWTEEPGRFPRFLLRDMAATCADCPVLARCEAFVEEAHITAGFWAGRSQWGKKLSDYPRSAPKRITEPEWIPVYASGRLVEEQAALPLVAPEGADGECLDGAA
jgi:hypothetical protein